MSTTSYNDLPDAGSAMTDLLSDNLQVEGPADVAVEAHEAQDLQDDQEAEETRQQAPQALQDDHDQAGDEASEDEPGDQDQDQDAEQDQDDDGEEADEPAPGETFKVKVDGEEIEVSRDEVIAGYQRQADYSRKTQALAEERKLVTGERQQYATMLTALQGQIEALAQHTGLTQEQAHALAGQHAAASAELDRLDAEHRAVQVQEGQRWLMEQVPEWNDATTRTKDFEAVVETARMLGYSDQELASASDPRALYAVHLAAKYLALKARAADVRQHAVKKGQKSLKPGSPEVQRTRAERTQSSNMKRLQKTGHLDDAAAVFSGMMDV